MKVNPTLDTRLHLDIELILLRNTDVKEPRTCAQLTNDIINYLDRKFILESRN